MRDKIIEVAKSQLFIKESGNNSTPYGKWYGMDGVAWCAIFVSWVYEKAGNPFSTPKAPNGFHYCPAGFNYWRSQRRLTTNPQAGDIVLFDWNKDKLSDHTGIFAGWQSKTHFYCIEGNTSVGNDSNGGQVMQRLRSVAMVQGFVNILDEPQTLTLVKNGDVGGSVRTVQAALVNAGYEISVDGQFGDETEKFVKLFQEKNGLEPDGIVGKFTLEKLGVRL